MAIKYSYNNRGTYCTHLIYLINSGSKLQSERLKTTIYTFAGYKLQLERLKTIIYTIAGYMRKRQ